METITIYTDGSWDRVLKCGGWGSYLYSDKCKELSDYSLATTISRMELTAVLEALRFINNKWEIKPTLMFYSDSKYTVEILEKLKTPEYRQIIYSKTYVKNKDLILKISRLLENITYSVEHTYGHSNNPYNEFVDYLAKTKMREARTKLKELKREVLEENGNY